MGKRYREAMTAANGLFAQGKYETALAALMPAIESRNGSREDRLHGLELAATACQQLARYADEVKLRRRRLELLRAAGERESLERVAIAQALLAQGKFSEASEALGEAGDHISPLERVEHSTMRALIVLRTTRDHAGAAELLRALLSTVDPALAPFEHARVLVILGHALRFAGKIFEAQQALQQAQTELSGLLDRDHRAVVEFGKSEFYLGDTYRLLGELKLAVRSYEHAKILLGTRASLHFTKRYYQRLAAVYYLLEEFDRARDAYLSPECLATVEKIGNQQDYFWSYLGAAKSLIALGNLPDAENYVAKAQAVAGDSPPALLRGHLALARGSMHQSRRAPEQADRLYREAEALFRQIGERGNFPGIIDALVSRALVALGLGDKQLPIKLSFECAELAAESGFLPLQARELFLKSMILAEDGGTLDDLFNDVLGRLDAITCPATMYKVVANIYHYARKFANYELDVSLEAKLKKLKDSLDKGVYERLWSLYVDRRFAQRIVDHLSRG